MAILDFFVLEEAWSKRLRDFVKRVQSFNAKTAASAAHSERRLDDAEADIGFLALLQVATLKLLSSKGVLRDDELVPHLAAVDMLDGVEDAKLDMNAVREAIGLPRMRGGAPKGAAKGAAKRAKPAAKKAAKQKPSKPKLAPRAAKKRKR
jgi:hypothetical protein